MKFYKGLVQNRFTFCFSVNENRKKRKLMSHKLQLGPLHLFCKQKAKFRSWKTLKGPGKGHGKSWDFRMLKGYEPCFSIV